MDIALSDPTQQQDIVRLTVAGMDTRTVEGADAKCVTFEQQGDDTKVVIGTSGAAGLSLTFSLMGLPHTGACESAESPEWTSRPPRMRRRRCHE